MRESGPWGHSRNMSSINLNLKLGAKELLFKLVHEQVGIGGGHTGAHGCTFDLEEMSGVEGEIVVGWINSVSLRRNRVEGWVWGRRWFPIPMASLPWNISWTNVIIIKYF